jgi:hypothetical protein
MTSLPADLRDAYRRTEYRVADGSYAFVLRIDQPSDSLRTCHAAFGVECSTFITAWNPRSESMPPDVNAAAMTRLEREIEARGLFVLHGVGIDPSGAWAGEPSLLVLGLDENAGVALARAFEQNAIVCASEDAVPRLVICR